MSERQLHGSDLEWSAARSTVQNFEQHFETIADSYPLGRAHGLQKDAIQNGIDAIKGSGTLDFEFELVENSKGRFLGMRDSGTTGLTGDVKTKEEYRNLQPEDKWARFESIAFTKAPDEEAIGARGQGKAIFYVSSSDHTIMYETLRDDGTYRLGWSQAESTGCPRKHKDGADAKKYLTDTTGMLPIDESGTRIIILDPKDEIVEAFKNGSLLDAIQETWFRAIEKKKAVITLKDGKDIRTAESPVPFPVPRKSNRSCKVWSHENDEITAGSETYRVKRLMIGFMTDPEYEIPPELRGVTIVHNTMKIKNIELRQVPTELKKRMFGFVEFDRDLDRELRATHNQYPNHYDLKWRMGIPFAIKRYVESHIRKFAEKELGWGEDPRESRKRTRETAENSALREISRYARDLKLIGIGGGGTPGRGGGNSPVKKIGVSFTNVIFPDEQKKPRLEFGEEVTFGIRAFNKTDNAIESATLRVYVVAGNTQIGSPIFEETDLRLNPNGETFRQDNLSVKFSKSVFKEPGRYDLRCKLIDNKEHEEVDLVSHYVFLCKDPDFRAPFQLRQADYFSDEYASRQWLTEGSIGNSPVLYYNIKHPHYGCVEEDDDQLADYLFEICLEGAMAFILERIGPDGRPDYSPLNPSMIEGEPNHVYFEVVGKIAEIRAHRYLS